MTKEEAKKLLEKLGVHVSEVTDEIVAKVEAYKAELDTETRRKTRLFWVIVAAVCSAVSFGEFDSTVIFASGRCARIPFIID